MLRRVVTWLGVLVLAGAVGTFVVARSGHGSATKDTTSGSTSATASTPESGLPGFVIVAGKSSCQQSESNATVNCSIAVRDVGGSAGIPTVYAIYRYDDGSHKQDKSGNGNAHCLSSSAIPAGTLGHVYFCHSYDARRHDLAGVEVSLTRKRWVSVHVVEPFAPGDTD